MKNTKEMKKLKIEPKGYINRFNTESGMPGECSTFEGVRERNNSVEAVGRWKTLGNVADGERLLLVDGRLNVDYYLSAIGNDIYLHGVKQGDVYTQRNEKLCSVETEPVCAQSVGRFVVISTQLGCRYLYFKDDTYILLDVADAIPQLAFNATNISAIHKTIKGESFKNAYTQWLELHEEDKSVLQSSVITAYNNIVDRAELKGVFIQPVSVRYALKLWDNSYSWVSAPVIVGNGVQMSGTVSPKVDTSLTSYEDSVISANVYNVGVTLLKKPSEEWLPLIKSIDVLVGEEMSPFVMNDVNCVCGTDSDSSRYISYNPVEKNRNTAVGEMINPEKWKVLASITDLTEIQDKVKVLWRKNTLPIVTGEYLSCLTSSINHDMVADAVLSVNGRLYMGGQKTVMRNMWHSLQFWGQEREQIPCEILVVARLYTSQGEAVKVTREAYDYTPKRLNPMVAYPDVRAVELTVKVLSNDVITEWKGKLVGVVEQGFACFVNEDLSEMELSESVSFYEPTEQNTIEQNGSQLVVYRNGNPFAVEQTRNVWQGEILDIALAPKSVYSSVFGRYPVYVFTTKGIYAVAYKELGDYKDVQLIDTRRLSASCTVATSRDRVYFVSDDNELCAISGKNVSVISSHRDVVQLIWLKNRDELMVLHTDNLIHVEMPGGHRYTRTERLRSVYGDLYNAFAVNDEGYLVDLNEEEPADIAVSLETYPIPVDVESVIAPLQLSINLTCSDIVKGVVELSGSEGGSCDWHVLASTELKDEICHPIVSRIYAKPCRLVKLRLNAECKSDLLFRNAVLTYC